MISFVKKIITYAIVLVCIVAVAIYFRPYFVAHVATIDDIGTAVDKNIATVAQETGIITAPLPPCSQPIVYTLGTFDSGFGLTQAQFLDDINQAVQIWDKPFGKTFFVLASSSATGSANASGASASNLKINLIYDYRQQATDAMNTLGVSIDDETTVYNALKAKYASLTSAYTTEKATLTAIEASFETAQASYDQTVAYWNSHGGAPQAEYAQLSQEKAALQSQADAITAEENTVNASVATINDTASTINKYVALLNSEATQYNNIASSTGEEFDEGEYVEDATGHHIDIFQYSTRTKLIRVLAHELGHSLGLGHSYTNPQAIMYPLNQGTDLSLAPEDVAALDGVCGIK